MPIDIPHDDILAEAYRLTSGIRDNQYGPPHEDLGRTAAMWTALLRDRLIPGEAITACDVAQAMTLLKLSRIRWDRTNRDSWADAAGYLRCGWLCVQADGADKPMPGYT